MPPLDALTRNECRLANCFEGMHHKPYAALLDACPSRVVRRPARENMDFVHAGCPSQRDDYVGKSAFPLDKQPPDHLGSESRHAPAGRYGEDTCQLPSLRRFKINYGSPYAPG